MTTYPVPLERRLADMLATLQRRVTLLESRSVVQPLGGGGSLFAAKPADTSMTSNVTLTNDADLTLPVAANAAYLMTSVLRYEADASGDLNTSWVGPAGATNVGTIVALLVSATSDANVYINNFSLGGSSGIGGRGAGVIRGVVFNGVVTTGASSGSLTLQWSQFTSSAIATILYAGSFVSLQRVA